VTENLANQQSLLRTEIIEALRRQGFQIQDGHIVAPDPADKDAIRDLHRLAVEHRLERSKPGLIRHEGRLLQRIAGGSDVDPETIAPELVEVLPGTMDELLFRYAALHWSIPVSSGYGRRLRFSVIDQSNEKLMGIIGLGDPVSRCAPVMNGSAGLPQPVGLVCTT
jgi:hypothetical protein